MSNDEAENVYFGLVTDLHRKTKDGTSKIGKVNQMLLSDIF
jgi:hypothetical protein